MNDEVGKNKKEMFEIFNNLCLKTFFLLLVFSIILLIAETVYLSHYDISLGYFFGVSASVVNLFLLSLSFLSLIFEQKNVLRAIFGVVGSFFFLGLLAFSITKYYQSATLGFCAGLASAIIVAGLFGVSEKKSLQTINSEVTGLT